jgi:dTDP-glucose 4,6-dehydratase
MANLAGLEGDKHFRFVKGNITNKRVVEKVMVDVDAVVHFAAESHVDRSVVSPGAFVRTNVMGTYVLLEAARQYGVRFHHVSTDEVYGSLARNGVDRFSEESKYDPRSPYSASKASADHLVRAYFHTYGLEVTISNCANNYGPFHFPEKLIPVAITRLLTGGKVPIYGDGGQVRDWLYVTDHCRAVDMIVRKGRVGETYLVGAMEEAFTNLELVRKIIRLMGRREEECIEFVTDRPGHDQRYAIDSSKIRKELGWKPMIDLDEGLAKTIKWYEENEGWWKTVV